MPVVKIVPMPGSNGQDGEGFNFRGAWVTNTLYKKNDVVTQNGSSYIANYDYQDTSGPSLDGDLWAPLALKGEDGTGSADIADFVFSTIEEPDYESTMTVTNNDMVIKTVVNTEASGNIKIESAQNIVLNANGDAYIGDSSSQNNRIATIGDVEDILPTISPLPDFLTYVEGRAALPTLNQNFGWDARGLWFGPTAVDSQSNESYPVFTNFTLSTTDKVFVSFLVDVDENCSDVGICVFPNGTIPNWTWGTDTTRIAAQFDCPNAVIHGLTISNSQPTPSLPSNGTYRIEFTYDPTLEADNVKFEYFELNNNVAIGSQTLTEILPSGNYRIGFASDNDINEEGGPDSPLNRTYISDLFISINNDQTTYSNTLQNGNSGGFAYIADFVFDYNADGEESRMTIHNHDMRIQTTRDDNEDADIEINSADDIWISSNDTLELESRTDEVRIRAGEFGQKQWNFRQDGLIGTDGDSGIETLDNGDIKGRLKFEPGNGRALLQAYGNNQTATFTDSWDTASWTILDSQQSQLTLTNASTIISFMEDTGYQVDNLKISVNGSYYAPYSGAGTGDGAITLYINELMPPDVEFTLTQLQFQYAFSSRVDIDFDEGDLTIRTEDEMDIVLNSADDVQINANGSVDIWAADININSELAPSSLNINTYSGAIINSARTSSYAPEDRVVATLGDLESGPKTWTAPNNSLYSIYQAHGGVSVELLSKAFHFYDQAYVESNFINVNYVELMLDNNTELLLTQIYNGSVKNRGIKLNDGSYVHNVISFFPVGPQKMGFELETNATFYTGSSYAIEIDYDGPPVLWWDASNLNIMPEGEEWKFRGAKIEYHAYSQDAGTIIGTIYIAADSGDRNTTHLEVNNGVSDLGSIQLWNRDGNEYELYAYRTDGNSDTLNIHWTAQVYFSPDREND